VTVRRSGLPGSPQLRERGQKLFQTFPPWTFARLARRQSGQGCLTFADAMQQFERVQSAPFTTKLRLHLFGDRGAHDMIRNQAVRRW
jgi:hypothetical protein